MYTRLIHRIGTYESKAFLPIVVIAIILGHGGAYAVWDTPYRGEDVLFQTQLAKLDSTPAPIDTIIIGDSAAGYALNAALFTDLTGSTTMSAALTRSHGFIGSLNMLKQARQRHPEIKNVFIIQSHDIWTLPFSREGFFKTEIGIDSPEVPSRFFSTYLWLDRIAYRSDLKWLYRYAKYWIVGPPESRFVNDYIEGAGEKATFKNGQLPVPREGLALHPFDPDQIEAFSLLDGYCAHEELFCVYGGAPLHATTLRLTPTSYFDQVFGIVESAHAIHLIPTLYPVAHEHMGDAITHLDSSYKDTMTHIYAAAWRAVRTATF